MIFSSVNLFKTSIFYSRPISFFKNLFIFLIKSILAVGVFLIFFSWRKISLQENVGMIYQQEQSITEMMMTVGWAHSLAMFLTFTDQLWRLTCKCTPWQNSKWHITWITLKWLKINYWTWLPRVHCIFFFVAFLRKRNRIYSYIHR